MARRKGSKNRSTLERELREQGEKAELEKLSYEELSARAVAVVPPPSLPVKEPVEKTIIDPAVARVIVEDTRRRFGIMVDYYTSEDDVSATGEGEFIPERIQEYLRSKVYFSSTPEEARGYAKKALDKLHTHLLVLWADKRIAGPDTATNIEKRAKKAQKWAERLALLGRFDEVPAQVAKVAAIRATPPNLASSPWLA